MDTEKKKIRVLLAKGKLDGHDRGVRSIAQALMGAGMEVVFIEFRIPEDIVIPALQENVDVIGISFNSGGQTRVAEEVMKLLEEKGMGDRLVILGGSIPPYDMPKLAAIGVAKIFTSGVSLKAVVDYVSENAGKN